MVEPTHPPGVRHGGVRMVVGINNFAYLIPYVEDNEELFLKTIIPSRKAAERYFRATHEGYVNKRREGNR